MAQPSVYREGELEMILSLAPTATNLKLLAKVLGRSEAALQLVYRAAYGNGAFPEGAAFNRKVVAAKKSLGITFGRRTIRPNRSSSQRPQ
jgi:hypothetical protein